MPSAAENHMCVKCMKCFNKQEKFLTTQYIGTCKSAYTKGYALNWALTSIINEYGLFRLNRRFALSQ